MLRNDLTPLKLTLKKGQNVPKDVITAIKECTEALKDYDKKEKSMYQNMFN